MIQTLLRLVAQLFLYVPRCRMHASTGPDPTKIYTHTELCIVLLQSIGLLTEKLLIVHKITHE